MLTFRETGFPDPLGLVRFITERPDDYKMRPDGKLVVQGGWPEPRHGSKRSAAFWNPCPTIEGVEILHAGTARKDGEMVAQGGRVLNIVATAPSIAEARRRAYAAIDRIDWPEGFCRTDIAWRAL